MIGFGDHKMRPKSNHHKSLLSSSASPWGVLEKQKGSRNKSLEVMKLKTRSEGIRDPIRVKWSNDMVGPSLFMIKIVHWIHHLRRRYFSTQMQDEGGK